MQAKVIQELKNILGSERVKEDLATRQKMALDSENLPEVAVFPADTEQVARVVRLANEEGIAVIPWGAGKHAWRGLLPYRGGIAISLSHLQNLVEFDQDNQTAYAEAGLTLAALNEAFRQGRLFLPVDPVEGDDCTLGGCIASNASGPRKLAYGTTKDHLLGLEVVLPTGEVVRTGGKTVKNVQDYDNTRFMAGTWGSLGIITKAMLKLKPLPEKEVTVCLGFQGIEKACDAAFTLRQELGPTALEVLDGRAVEALKRAGYSLPVSSGDCVLAAFAGFEEAVDWQAGEVQKKFGQGARVVICTPEQAETVWAARRQVFKAFAGDEGALLGSAALPFTATGKFIQEARSLLTSLRREAALVAHLGNGHVHVFVRQAPAAYREIQDILERLQNMASQAGGLFLVDNIEDLSMVRRWVESRGSAVLPLMKRIKEALDPRCIMTPNSKVLAYVLATS